MGDYFSRRALLRAVGLSVALPVLHAADAESTGVSALLDGKGFVRIAPGEFLMGSENGNPDERPVHRVRISRGFELGRFEVTQEQWDGVMRNPHGSAATPAVPSHFKGTGLPVEYISWNDVQLFLNRMNARDEAHTYRLPTEAEWEYACGAGGGENHPASLDERGWYERNADERTHPVGEKAPNAWGLYDMFGNVAEWVQDWYLPEYYLESPATDPQGPETGSYRVYRGGCWFDSAGNLRAAYRGFDFPGNQSYNVGFRLVRVSKG